MRTLNDWIAVFVILLVALSPLPLGSARPHAWTLSATAVCLVAAVAILVQPPQPATWAAWPALALQLAFCVALILQLVPGPWVSPVVAQDGVAYRPGTISLSPGATWLMLLRQIGYGAFVMLALRTGLSHRRAHWMLLAVFAITVFYAVLGLLMLVQWRDAAIVGEKTAYLGSATGPFVNHNSFAMFLSIGLSAGAAWLLHLPKVEWPRSQRVLAGFALVLCLAVVAGALVATNSRLGVLSGFAALATVLLLGLVRAGRLRWWMVLGAVGMVALTTALLAAFGGDLLIRFASIDPAHDPRWSLYDQVWDATLLRPWQGYGGGAFQWAFILFERPPLSPDLVWEKAHSSYLQLWFEMGFFAGTLPLLALAVLIWWAVRGYMADASRGFVGLAAIGAAIVVALHSLFDFGIEIQANTYLFLAVLSLGAASGLDARRRLGVAK